MISLVSTAYWPNQYYFYQVLSSQKLIIEQYEHYQKQSYRNRCTILSANGPLDLTIPVVNEGNKQVIKDLRISYKDDWPIKHWRALTSAYKNSPYFELFEPEIYFFYSQRFDTLLEYNLQQVQLLLNLVRRKVPVELSSEYIAGPEGVIDLRERIHPKRALSHDDVGYQKLLVPYSQVFDTKFSFQPNLSMLDLFFNKGLESLDYLGK